MTKDLKAKYVIFDEGSVAELPEDGTIACVFNLMCAEMVKYKIEQRQLLNDAIEVETRIAMYPDTAPIRCAEDCLCQCHVEGCSCHIETPWTEEEHEDLFYAIAAEVPLLWSDFGISPVDLSEEEYNCADEANIIERHPDYSWVWEE
jgi:hypothetical protein